MIFDKGANTIHRERTLVTTNDDARKIGYPYAEE